MPRQPLLTGRQHAALWREQGTKALPRFQAIQYTLKAPAHDNRVRTRTSRQASRTQLGLHAATPQRTTGTACHCIQRRIIGTRLVDHLGIRVITRISVKHAVAIGQDHQQISLDQIGHQCCQRIVVTKTDFVGDHRVIFVNDRDHTQLHQRTQRAAGIEVTLAIRQVVMGQQNLRGMPGVLGKARLPGLHQPHLTNSRSSLQLVHGTRSHRPAQTAHAGRHGTRRHQHQLNASLVQRHHLLHPNAHRCAIQAFAIRCQQRAADLDNPALRTRHLAPHHHPTYA